MKNKKILSRVLAFSAVLVLMAALALPCFADSTGNETLDSFIASVPDAMHTPALNALVAEKGSDLLFYDTLASGYLSTTSNIVGFMINGSGTFLGLSQGSFAFSDGLNPPTVLDNVTVVFSADTYAETLSIFLLDDLEAFNIFAGVEYSLETDNNIYYATLKQVLLGDLTIPASDVAGLSVAYVLDNATTTLQNNIPSVLFGSTDVAHPTQFMAGYYANVDGEIPPTRTGMYGDLYDILRDAIFGDNVILDASQDYALTLLSTVLTYVIVLAPVIIVVCIAVWCFKRW